MADDVRALSLWQPWASLIPLGVKTIETRSWSTSWRGTLLIHASLRRPKVEEMKTVVGDNLEAWNAWYLGGLVDAATADVRCPLGVVVATARLTDVVPIVPWGADPPSDHITVRNDGGLNLWRFTRETPRGWALERAVSDQLPYGDYSTDGKPRYGWLLEDVKALDPPVSEYLCPDGCDEGEVAGEYRMCSCCEGAATVLVRGRQGLWKPERELVEACCG